MHACLHHRAVGQLQRADRFETHTNEPPALFSHTSCCVASEPAAGAAAAIAAAAALALLRCAPWPVRRPGWQHRPGGQAGPAGSLQTWTGEHVVIARCFAWHSCKHVRLRSRPSVELQ
jgi:hypothetical protein